MSTLGLSKRARAVVDAVITAYERGGSYNAVAREVGLSSATVRKIMTEHSPGSVRSREQQIKVRIQPKPAMALTAFELFRVGPCLACKVEIVSVSRETGQLCGFCKVPNGFKAPRRAA